MNKVIASAVLLVLLPVLAHAHAHLSSSLPADQASLESPPTELALHFSEPVRLTALTVARDGERPQPIGSLPANALKDFALAAPALAAGSYRVSWRALAADSHVMTGTFAFTVVAATESPASSARGHAGHSQH